MVKNEMDRNEVRCDLQYGNELKVRDLKGEFHQRRNPHEAAPNPKTKKRRSCPGTEARMPKQWSNLTWEGPRARELDGGPEGRKGRTEGRADQGAEVYPPLGGGGKVRTLTRKNRREIKRLVKRNAQGERRAV